jgi:hypothetical protein
MRLRTMLLIALASLATACENPVATRVTITDDAGVSTAAIARGMYLTFSFPYDTWTRIWTLAPVGLLTYTHDDHHVYVFCHGVGSGQIHIELTGPQGYLEVNEPIECLNSFRPIVNQPFNVTSYFWALDGRTVKDINVAPTNLAKKVAMGANLSAAVAEEITGGPTLSIRDLLFEENEGDIGVECDEEGEGTLTVVFDGSSESFPLTCAAHDQGNGG